MSREPSTYEVYLEVATRGMQAAREGKSPEDNPYPNTPGMSKWWNDAYRAEKDRLDVN